MGLEVGAGGAGGWGENDDKAMKGIMYLSAIKKMRSESVKRQGCTSICYW